ncbi:ABC transporter permease [candidate division WOR-3 bacterium]|nr:ABC transporter permease [candidate division WOR-3 bacterium]
MIAIFKEIYKYRELLLTLALRDVKSRYKQSVLGITWALFVPLIAMLVFTFVFSKFVKVDTGGIPYPIFAYCGILPWTFFAASLNTSINSLVANGGLVTKIYFPREVFPLASIAASFVDFCIATLVLLGLMLFYHIHFHLTILLVIPILLLQIMLTAGLGFIFSMANLFFRDIRYLFQVIIPLWMFATPVVYPIPEKFRWLYIINPMAPIISSYRSLIIEGSLPDMTTFSISILISLTIFIIGALWFHRAEYLFAENI